MDHSSPPTIPYSPDPAIFLHSEVDDTIDPNRTLLLSPYINNSDDLEALHAQQDETIAEKSKRGQVIQHRAWKVADAFRSDEGYQGGQSPV
jgi:chromosome transmission fidelity protein 18